MDDREEAGEYQPIHPTARIRTGTSESSKQRRLFFRIPIAMEIIICPQASNLPDKEEPEQYYTLDISGGGLSFLCSRELEIAAAIGGTLHLITRTSHKKLPFCGRIVCCEPAAIELYRISLEFVQLNHSVRSDIIRFCKLKQAESRSKLANYFT